VIAGRARHAEEDRVDIEKEAIMEDRKSVRWTTAGLAAALMAWASAAAAVDSPQRVELMRRSVAQGLGRAQVVLLSRLAGAGSLAVAQLLLGRFAAPGNPITTRGAVETTQARDHVFHSGPGWSLRVYGDGSRASYRNDVELDRRQNLARPVSERLSLGRLETLGRIFMSKQLKGVVRLGPGEALVPLFTRHQVKGGGSTAEGAKPVPEKVVASTIVFGRTVNGVHIIGPGSKVAITFANDGTPVAFDYDWPVYRRTGRSQSLLSTAELKSRADDLLTVKLDTEGVSLKRMECGYFDLGARHHDPEALVQAACSYQYSKRTIVDPELHRSDPASGHVMGAFMQAIPAAQSVEPDHGWREAAQVRGEVPGGAGDKAPPPPPSRP
jgi:hypothetical protein